MTTPSPLSRSPELLNRGDSRLVLIDMQERLLTVMEHAEAVVNRCGRLLQAANIFDVPVDATQQYSKGLGPTVEPLSQLLADLNITPTEKLRFSSASSLDWAATSTETTNIATSDNDRPKIVLAGSETHVCVLQTALDLLSEGFSVYIPVDAVTSRHNVDHKVALKRLRDSGATLTTSESVLFEWCETAASDQFKQISQLVR